MANSNYYFNLYRQNKDEESSLQKNIDALTKIRNNLSGDFCDEQRNVNKELDDLKEDLQKAIRNDQSWLYIASQCNLYKEKASTLDGKLESAIDYLDAEISSLRSKQNSAKEKKETAYNNYQKEREIERNKKRNGR